MRLLQKACLPQLGSKFKLSSLLLTDSVTLAGFLGKACQIYDVQSHHTIHKVISFLGDCLGLSGRLCQQLNPARHQPGNETPLPGIFSDSHGAACQQPPACAAASQPTLSQGPNLRSCFSCIQHDNTIFTMDLEDNFAQKVIQILFYYFVLASATILRFGLQLYFERRPPLLF